MTPTPTRWRGRWHIGRRNGIGLATLGLLAIICAAAVVRRAYWIGDRLLREWAVRTIAEGSDGVYQLDIGRVRVNWVLRRVGVDSIRLTTRRALNARRPRALANVRLGLYDCAISGVHFVTLVRSGGLIADSFGCRSGSLAVEMPRGVRPGAPGPAPAALGFVERPAFLVFQQGVRLPPYAPRIRIARVVFPQIALDVRLPRTAHGAIRLELESLEWTMADLVLDPTDTSAAARPLFSRRIDLQATDFLTHPDRATVVRVAWLRTSLTDSTLEIRGVSFAPSKGGAAFRRSRRYRHDLIELSAGRLTAQGIDFGALLVGDGVRARRIEVDSFRIEIRNDRRRPEGPSRRPHRTPQQWVADLDETLRLDSLQVRNGEVVYRQHAAGRARPGVFTFANIEAAAENVNHVVGRHTRRDPMTLTARAHVQHAGRLDLHVVVPLDAPRFALTMRGTLGAMSALAFNPFVVETQALRMEHGRVATIDFRLAVENGVARGTITPRYNDLSVSITRSGSDGILGSGGILGGAARGIASLAAGTRLRSDNPDDPASAPRVGTIRRRFTPDQTLIAFLWAGVRDGLLSVVRK